jgi:hypothetical protein
VLMLFMELNKTIHALCRHLVATSLCLTSVHNINQWKPKPSGTMKLTCACAPWYPSSSAYESGTISRPRLTWKRRNISGILRCRLKAWLESCASWPNTKTLKWKQNKKRINYSRERCHPHIQGGWTPHAHGGDLLCQCASGAPRIEIMCKMGQHCHLDIFLKIRQEPLYEITFNTNCKRLHKITCLLH